MNISIIVAMTAEGIIGLNHELPWKIKEELKYFRKLTLHKPIIMGSNTFRTLNFKPLPGRFNIVLTSNILELEKQIQQASANQQLNNELTANLNHNLVLVNNVTDGLAEAIAYLERVNYLARDQEIMIIGGAKVYQQFLPLAQRIYISVIKNNYIGNVLFPKYNLSEWELLSNQEYPEFTAQIWGRIADPTSEQI